MKKSSRQIPDFSRKSSRPKGATTPTELPSAKPKVASTPPRPKPQATIGKTGQRGK
jgi:hypothetical protein